MVDTFSCPKCGRMLARSREIAVELVAFSVFPRHECLSSWEVKGEVFHTASTFAVDAVGKPFDRAPNEGELPL
jgi:hypothetical protein